MISCDNNYNPIILSVLAGLLFVSCQTAKQEQEGNETVKATYEEPYRPQFHFSPAENWMEHLGTYELGTCRKQRFGSLAAFAGGTYGGRGHYDIFGQCCGR